jgi:hypothetical protein
MGSHVSTEALTTIRPWLRRRCGSAAYVGYTFPQKLMSWTISARPEQQ